TDNGSGIPAGEVTLAFQRHATSKIRNFADLESILSLGFRGEALPSIAAAALVDITTCAAGELAGSHLSLKDGIIVDQTSQGHPQGTTVTVRNLFRSLPARLKFLKALSTESSHIADVVSQYALAFPEVKFSLSIDNRTTLTTPGSGRLIDSVIAVYGVELASQMLELNRSDSDWAGDNAGPAVTGLVSAPSVNRSSRGYLSFFVNRRWINSRLLSWAVEEAYHGLLMTGKHPVAIINISLPPSEVDINVHPTKTEVKFRNERLVFGTVQKAVRQALVAMAPVPRVDEVATAYRGAPTQPIQPLWRPKRDEHHPAPTRPATEAQPTPALSLPALRLLGQLAGSYIIAEGPDGLYLIDQHAAHERILFEKIKQQLSRQQIEVQGLLEPSTLEVNPQQDAVLKPRYQDLAEFGFNIEPFGDRTYLVRAVPALLHQKDWAGALRELLDTPSATTPNDWRENTAISIACHSAIRAGHTLTDDVMRELLRQLEQAAIPNTCPHGRPTMIHLTSGHLEREFGRI
ncbi:MAG: DNA mismatch repair endonuclease MutL, partial [Chloroflexi bacterium]|nr:DNA mismatch repair endonuclease MutL [Chloroflexota bacterium]